MRKREFGKGYEFCFDGYCIGMSECGKAFSGTTGGCRIYEGSTDVSISLRVAAFGDSDDALLDKVGSVGSFSVVPLDIFYGGEPVAKYDNMRMVILGDETRGSMTYYNVVFISAD